MQEGSNFANLIYAGRKINVKDPGFFHRNRDLYFNIDGLLSMCNAVKYKGSKLEKKVFPVCLHIIEMSNIQ